MDFTELRHLAEQIETECGKAIIGKGEQIRLVLTSLFAGGHVLIDDIPGVGKTTLVKALSAVLGCGMVPGAVHPGSAALRHRGHEHLQPENRGDGLHPRPHHDQHPAGGRDQPGHPPYPVRPAEAMEERQVSVDGVTYPLAPPFMVLATQNPVETETTFALPCCPAGPLPLQALHGLPHPQGGGRHAPNRGRRSRLCGPPPLLSPEEVNRFTREIRQVRLSDPVVAYIVELVQATREQPELACGASPGCPGTCSGPPKPMPPSPAGTMSPRTM